MSQAGNLFRCACCGEDKPDDGTAVFDKVMQGPVDGECHYRLCMASKWLSRGYKWKPEDGDEAKQFEGPCSSRVMVVGDIDQSNFNRFKLE